MSDKTEPAIDPDVPLTDAQARVVVETLKGWCRFRALLDDEEDQAVADLARDYARRGPGMRLDAEDWALLAWVHRKLRLHPDHTVYAAFAGTWDEAQQAARDLYQGAYNRYEDQRKRKD